MEKTTQLSQSSGVYKQRLSREKYSPMWQKEFTVIHSRGPSWRVCRTETMWTLNRNDNVFSLSHARSSVIGLQTLLPCRFFAGLHSLAYLYFWIDTQHLFFSSSLALVGCLSVKEKDFFPALSSPFVIISIATQGPQSHVFLNKNNIPKHHSMNLVRRAVDSNMYKKSLHWSAMFCFLIFCDFKVEISLSNK